MKKIFLAAAIGSAALAAPAAAQEYTWRDGYTYTPDANDRVAYYGGYRTPGPLHYHDYDRDERDNGYFRDKQYSQFLRDNSLVDDTGDDGY
jgi:hypothetical protein